MFCIILSLTIVIFEAACATSCKKTFDVCTKLTCLV